MMDYAKRVRDNVEQSGFHTTAVVAGDRPTFSYSTGIFQSYRLPELIISSLPPGLCHDLISQYVARFRETGPIIGKRIVAIEERFDYYLVPVSFECIKELVLATLEFYSGVPVEFLQLIYPDTDFLFPGEDGYDYDQEIFGEFPPK